MALEQEAGALVGRGEDLSEPDLLPGGRSLAPPPLGPVEQPRAEPPVPVLGVDVDVDVVVADEGRVGDQTVVLLDHHGVELEIEAGHVPVGEQVVELEVGRAELVDIACHDQVGHGLSLVGPGGAKGLHGRH